MSAQGGSPLVSLAGRRAAVTGASGDIGRAIALALAAAGADVALLARRRERLETLAAEMRALGRQAAVVPVDVTDAEAVAAAAGTAADRLGPIDVLVNNAAAPASWRRLWRSPRAVGPRPWH